MPSPDPCETCRLREIEPYESRADCTELARTVISYWWHGNPTVQLSEVAFDELQGSGVDDGAREILNDCMTEHASERCGALNPYGV